MKAIGSKEKVVDCRLVVLLIFVSNWIRILKLAEPTLLLTTTTNEFTKLTEELPAFTELFAAPT